MFLFDIKYFILVSIFENVLVLEGLKKVKKNVFAPYRSFYLRNDRRNNDFDYNFKDWETTTVAALYILRNPPLNITENENFNQTLTKEETITITTIQTIPSVENFTKVTQEISEVTSKQDLTANTESTLPSIQETHPTVNVTNSPVQDQNSSDANTDADETVTPDVTLPPEATIKDLLNWLATTPLTKYTTLLPPPPTVNIEDLMPGTTDDILDHTVPQSKSTKNPFLDDIKDGIKNKHGYFTSSLTVLLTVLSKKNSNDVQNLLTALNTKIESYITIDALAVFGSITVEAFQSVIQMLILAPVDIRKGFLKFAVYTLENRHIAMRDDVNAVFDVVDSLYTDSDVAKIASVVKRIDAYPNIKTDILILASDTLNAFVFDPHNRILDTAKERLLLTEIHNLLQHRLYPGKNLMRRFRKRKENGKFTREWKSAINIPYYRQYSRKQSKYNPISIHYFKPKSTLRNRKHINIKDDQNILYWENAKDQYDVKKIARTVKNFYSDRGIKKIAFENSLQFNSATSSESSCSHYESSVYSQESRYNSNSKTVKDKYSFKSDEKDFRALNKDKNEPKSTKHKTVITHVSTRYSAAFDKLIPAQSMEENILKLNLIDALLHSGKSINNSRNFMKKINKVKDIESFSDNEALLKSNIYKFFGLSNDFRKKLRTLHMLRKTSSA